MGVRDGPWPPARGRLDSRLERGRRPGRVSGGPPGGHVLRSSGSGWEACVVANRLCLFAASWSVSQASLFITPFYLKITRSYRNSAESHVSFTQLPPMMLLYVPTVRAGKLTSSLFCRESCIWVKAGAQIQTALSALFGQHPLSASTSFLLEGRGTSALPPQTLIRNPPLPPPSHQNAVLGLPHCLGQSFWN